MGSVPIDAWGTVPKVRAWGLSPDFEKNPSLSVCRRRLRPRVQFPLSEGVVPVDEDAQVRRRGVSGAGWSGGLSFGSLRRLACDSAAGGAPEPRTNSRPIPRRDLIVSFAR